MQTIMYVELNAFALAILFLIYSNVTHRSDKYLTEQKLFLALLGSNALVLVLDTGMWILDGRTFFGARELFFFVTAMYYTMNPMICMIWSFYADYRVYRDEKRFKKFLIPMLLPVIINGILSFLSFSGNLMFYIDGNNVYHRGSLFLLMAAICYGYLMNSLVLIVRKRERIQKQYFMPIFAFFFPPFIGGIIQIFFYGVSLIWVCMTLSVLVVFINIQSDQLYTDHLTGLFNRRQLDYYLDQRVAARTDKKILAGIMIDLNGFKAINDLLGHHVGDQALMDTAAILKTTFRKSDFVSRYGGDEFVIIMEMTNPLDLENSVERLLHNVSLFNSRKTTPYSISFSIGYDYFDRQSGATSDDFIRHIDSLMYKDKLSIRDGGQHQL